MTPLRQQMMQGTGAAFHDSANLSPQATDSMSHPPSTTRLPEGGLLVTYKSDDRPHGGLSCCEDHLDPKAPSFVKFSG